MLLCTSSASASSTTHGLPASLLSVLDLTLLPHCCCGPLSWPRSDGYCYGSLACTCAITCPLSENSRGIVALYSAPTFREVPTSLAGAASSKGRLADGERNFEHSLAPSTALLYSEKAPKVPGFPGAVRPRNSLRGLLVALLGLLGVVIWSCSLSTAGALLAKQAIAPGEWTELSSR